MGFVGEFKQYNKLIRSYWLNRKSTLSWLLLIGSLAFSWFFVYLSVYINQLFAKMYDYVEQRDKVEILNVFKTYAIVISLYIIAHCLKNLLLSLSTFRWREFLTEKILQLWLGNKKYHRVKEYIDNPDQRISEDINFFCTSLLKIFVIFLGEGATFIAFIGVLWYFPYSFDFSFMSHDFSIPHYLAIGSILYAVVMNYLLILIGKPLISLNYEKERKEADYRYSLMRVGSYSEEMAFNQGERIELGICEAKFDGIKQNYYALIRKTFALDFFNYGYAITISVLPMFAAIPLFFEDKISFGELMQITGAASNVLVAFGVLITNFSLIASLQAAKNRLIKLVDSLDLIDKKHSIDLNEKFVSHDSQIKMSDVTFINEKNKIFLEDLNFELELGKRLLIIGKSGCGKTSVLRMLAKIWSPASGRVQLPNEPIYFVPQRSYLPLGTLQACLNYPYKTLASEDDLIVSEVLSSVGLEHLLENLDVEKDYLKILSLGELQRLNFARILLHKPKIIVMDEPTSALDENNEKLMFSLLDNNLDKTTTIITVSHSKELVRYHDYLFEMEQQSTLTQL